jgi:hypothetical protein
MSCFLQDDLKTFVSEPPPPPQLVEVPEEGKPRPRSGVTSTKDTTQLPSKTRPMRTTTRRHCRTASSCGRGSAVLAYLMCLSFRIRRLA